MRKIYDLLCIARQRWEKTIRILKLTTGLILFAMLSASAVNNESEIRGSEITAMQQGRIITGKVTDQTGASLPGVSIVVKGTTTGVITDNNGNYLLSNIPENAILKFSFIGMRTQEIGGDAFGQ